MYLIIQNGKEIRHLLAEPFLLIGRGADCHLTIRNPSVSRRQCHLVRRQQRDRVWYQVLDGHLKASRNGTWVNGKKLGVAPHDLRNGDTISFAGVTMVYEDLAEVSEDSGTYSGEECSADTGSSYSVGLAG